MKIKGLISKSTTNEIRKILPEFTKFNVFLGKFVYIHIYLAAVLVQALPQEVPGAKSII